MKSSRLTSKKKNKMKRPSSAVLSSFLNKLWNIRKLLFFVVFVMLVCMLCTWSPLDESWFRTSSVASDEQGHNMLGSVGAQVSDALYIVFGKGAWVFVLLCLQQVFPAFDYVPSGRYERPRFQMAKKRQIDQSSNTLAPRFRVEMVLSFVVFLLATCAFFSFFFSHINTTLPEGMGGVLGDFVADKASYLLGRWAPFVTLLVLAVSASIFLNFSWFNLCEGLGGWTIFLLKSIYNRFQTTTESNTVVAPAHAPHKHINVMERGEDGKRVPVAHINANGIENELPEHLMGFTSGTATPAKLSKPSSDEPFETIDLVAELDQQASDEEVSPEEEVVINVPSVVSSPSSQKVDTTLTPRSPEPAVLSVEKPTEIQAASKINASQQDTLFSEFRASDMAAPPLSLLDPAPAEKKKVPLDTIEYTSRLIEKKLSEFNIPVEVKYAVTGPVITRYEFEPGPGIKGNKIVNHSKDLARSLSLEQVRVVETIPGKRFMGVELPNPVREIVHISEIIGSKKFMDAKSKLTVAMGKDIAGSPVIMDIASMPHLLVAGTTGSGKSVGMNAMIVSILYKAKPSEVKMIMIDPKMLEMSIYEDIPHLLAPVVTDTSLAMNALNWCVGEMERRYRLMSHVKGRNIKAYNEVLRNAAKKGQPIRDPFWPTEDKENAPILEPLPYIVIFVDELADLIMSEGKTIEQLIARLAQKARAAGMHLVLATQRPSVDVVTGLIKANVPARVAFQVSSSVDSRTILGSVGAETLLGKGDMLLMTSGSSPARAHCAFVSDDEVQRVVDYVKSQGTANYLEDVLSGQSDDSSDGTMSGVVGSQERDELYDQAVAVILEHQRASISFVQRKLRIGYNRTASIFEQMEEDGIVSKPERNGNRRILARQEEETL